MVCGIDSFHEASKKSVGGFVASLDIGYTKWFSKTCFQETGQELLNGLIHCFLLALKKYVLVSNILNLRN